MSAEAFTAQLPTYLTLDDVAAMADVDQRGHRFELGPGGILTVMPPPGVEHAMIASQLLIWFATHGWPAKQILQNVGLKLDIDRGIGGRVPDLTVWSAPPVGPVWSGVKNLLLAIEIISPGSEPIDRVIKKEEYAAAGIPRYWIVNSDAGNSVTMLRLAGEEYRQVQVQPLSWLLNTDPADHLRD
jgi:Uma2 family endonuclease